VTEVNETLQQRSIHYGKSFLELSKISQDLKFKLRSLRNWTFMDEDEREALEMIVVKLARLMYGDPHHIDSWHDIAGYATLVEERLRKENRGTR
jgi:hypothetical protein